ncbi:MAG: hypothetical protein HY661_03390 [Betaproteobacteria bacterium]|nr:hypothetical protein [Betaproteobacteria bacterium]
MKHSLFSWHARVPVEAGDYFLLDSDIKVLCRRISRLCLDAEFVVGNDKSEVLFEGKVLGISCAIAWDIGAAMEAFAGRHAINYFVYKTTCNGKVAEHVMGTKRASSPGSRGERLPSFEKVLGKKNLPGWAPLSCAKLLDSGNWAPNHGAQEGG